MCLKIQQMIRRKFFIIDNINLFFLNINIYFMWIQNLLPTVFFISTLVRSYKDLDDHKFQSRSGFV